MYIVHIGLHLRSGEFHPPKVESFQEMNNCVVSLLWGNNVVPGQAPPSDRLTDRQTDKKIDQPKLAKGGPNSVFLRKETP